MMCEVRATSLLSLRADGEDFLGTGTRQDVFQALKPSPGSG